MSHILVKNGLVITLDDNGTQYDPGYLLTKEDTIYMMGAGDPPASVLAMADQVVDASGMVVMPGMVNAHTHLFQTFIRGLADDRPLLKWLETAIWPVAKGFTGADAYTAAKLGFVENIRSGVTSVIDHQYVHTEPSVDDGVFRAAEEMGLRFMLAYGWADMNYHPALQLTPSYIEKDTRRLYETWHGRAGGRLNFEFGPVIPWGCTDETVLHLNRLAAEWKVGTHIHVAETKEEVDMNLRDRGSRHIEWLRDLGLLGPSLQLVHSVWLDDGELALIRDSGAVVVHCPVSNMYLASGAARVRDMLRMGIPVALATDGPGSNNSQDMMEVLKTTALLAKLSTLDAMAVLPSDVLHCACRGGAAAFGQAESIGSLELGKKADLVLVDLDSPFAMPVHKPLSALVYNLGASAVDSVMIDGAFVMRDKTITVLDEKRLLQDARRQCAALFSRAGVSV
jgi:5-methylthioadenosine/S-adenosylhomocysteine deaminase